MNLNYNHLDLEITRGDTLAFAFEMAGLDQDIDEAFFTVKDSPEDEEIFRVSLGNGIQKDETEEDVYTVRVPPATAELLEVGQYYYDLQVGVNGDIFTLLKGILRVGYDVTR